MPAPSRADEDAEPPAPRERRATAAADDPAAQAKEADGLALLPLARDWERSTARPCPLGPEIAFRRRSDAESWILLAIELDLSSSLRSRGVDGWAGVWGASEEESFCTSFSFFLDMIMEIQEPKTINAIKTQTSELRVRQECCQMVQLSKRGYQVVRLFLRRSRHSVQGIYKNGGM